MSLELDPSACGSFLQKNSHVFGLNTGNF